MIHFFIIIIISLCAFWPIFSAGFLQFDDPQHVLLNPAVNTVFPESMALIFSQSVNKIYLPLTTLSFAIEKNFFGFNPFIFHLDNFLLHVGVAFALFYLFKQLGFKSLAVLFAIIIFAIHPMKVESVAWITERKDVLYAFLYLLSLISYTHYVKKNSLPHYGLAIACSLLSILSKPMALSLPLILFLFDWFLGRKNTLKIWLDKIPFMIIAGGIGWITYAQNIRNPITDLGSSLLIWIWSFCFYLWKFLCPVNVYAFYKLPQPITLFSWEYALSFFFFALFLLSAYLWRNRRVYILAVGIYFLSIFFLLRFDIGIDASVVNDRFMYLPCIGFCLLLGIVLSKLWLSRSGKIIVIILFALLTLKTNLQSRIWNNTLTFYSEVIRAYPDTFSGYNNRAHYYYQTGDLKMALADYNQAIELKPDFAKNYIGRGSTYGLMKSHAKAIADFNTALSIDPALSEAYFNRSISWFQTGMFQEALQDAKKAHQMGAAVPTTYLELLESKTK